MSEDSRRRRRSLLALAGVIVLASIWMVAGVLATRDGDWARVRRNDLVVGIDVEGELQAVDTATIGPPQNRQIWNFKISMMAPEGSEVEVGQPILAFDTTQQRQELQEKQAERDAAEKELEKSTTDLKIERRGLELQLAEARGRLRRAELKLVAPEDVVPEIELETSRIDRELAELEILSVTSRLNHLEARSGAELAALQDQRDRAAGRLQELQDQIAQMTITAPRSGTLIYLESWRGEKKKVGDSAWRSEKIVEIPDLAQMRAEGTVAEADAGRLEVGQPVILRLDAHPDHDYRGAVSQIRRSVQRKSRSRGQKVVKLEIELRSTDTERMRPGMRFRGEIEVERMHDVLVVPKEAVIPRPGGAVVQVRDLWRLRDVTPTLGARSEDEFQVVSGLDEGDLVLRHVSVGDEDDT